MVRAKNRKVESAGELRSRVMRAVKSENSKPELSVRSALHRAGFRFRLHRKDLPGTPDVVLPRYKLAIFVHGCFWHGHRCKNNRRPRSNLSYWLPKIANNKKRDIRVRRELRAAGWKSMVVWECKVRNPRDLRVWTRDLVKSCASRSGN